MQTMVPCTKWDVTYMQDIPRLYSWISMNASSECAIDQSHEKYKWKTMGIFVFL